MKMDQAQISKISEEISKDIPRLLSFLSINYTKVKNRYTFACPIHGGDNETALSIFETGKTSIGNWSCFTHHCEEDFGRNLLGFTWGVLSKRDGTDFGKTLKIMNDYLGGVEVTEKVESDEWKYRVFTQDIEREPPPNLSKEKVRGVLRLIPCYYLNRGYSYSILGKFDVGLCDGYYPFALNDKKIYNRVIVPVYDENDIYVGCVARLLGDGKPKWLNDFQSSQYLYGLNFAKNAVSKEKGVVNVVEGQGDVWRMFEAGYENTVGLFGSSISDEQIILLERVGCISLNIMTDMDEAGEKAARKITKKCGRRFNLNRVILPKKDVGEMRPSEIKKLHL